MLLEGQRKLWEDKGDAVELVIANKIERTGLITNELKKNCRNICMWAYEI